MNVRRWSAPPEFASQCAHTRTCARTHARARAQEPCLEAHLLSRDSAVRAAAVGALARLWPMGSWAGEARLMTLDPDPLVRAAATT